MVKAADSSLQGPRVPEGGHSSLEHIGQRVRKG